MAANLVIQKEKQPRYYAGKGNWTNDINNLKVLHLGKHTINIVLQSPEIQNISKKEKISVISHYKKRAPSQI